MFLFVSFLFFFFWGGGGGAGLLLFFFFFFFGGGGAVFFVYFYLFFWGGRSLFVVFLGWGRSRFYFFVGGWRSRFWFGLRLFWGLRPFLGGEPKENKRETKGNQKEAKGKPYSCFFFCLGRGTEGKRKENHREAICFCFPLGGSQFWGGAFFQKGKPWWYTCLVLFWGEYMSKRSRPPNRNTTNNKSTFLGGGTEGKPKRKHRETKWNLCLFWGGGGENKRRTKGNPKGSQMKAICFCLFLAGSRFWLVSTGNQKETQHSNKPALCGYGKRMCLPIEKRVRVEVNADESI